MSNLTDAETARQQQEREHFAEATGLVFYFPVDLTGHLFFYIRGFDGGTFSPIIQDGLGGHRVCSGVYD
jgi:hypothetical protein